MAEIVKRQIAKPFSLRELFYGDGFGACHVGVEAGEPDKRW